MSATFAVSFRDDGIPRRWFKLFLPGVRVQRQTCEQLHALYGDRAQLVRVSRAAQCAHIVIHADDAGTFCRGAPRKPAGFAPPQPAPSHPREARAPIATAPTPHC